MFSRDENQIIVIDDMQTAALNDIFMANLFIRESHHRDISIILILKNLFQQGKYCRDIPLNTHYFILFKNSRDIQQIKLLGRQLGIQKIIRSLFRCNW